MKIITITLLLFLFAVSIQAQTIRVKGKVTDLEGESLVGVTVAVEGTTTATFTDMNGRYSIQVEKKDNILVFSYLGMNNVTKKVGSQTKIDVEMEESNYLLDEVVVNVGYGTARKVDLTGSVGAISGSELAKMPVNNIAEALGGKIAGLEVTTSEGGPGAEIRLKVRGGGSITQSNAPLYIIDGFPSDLGITGLDPSQIESVTVLKDASSTAIYGARGANGVILITTKSGTSGRTTVTYNGYVSVRKMARYMDMMSPYDFVLLQFEQMTTVEEREKLEKGYGKWNEIYDRYGNEEGVSWQKQVFGETAVSHSHNINITGGTKQTNFNLSASYSKDEGILMRTSADKLMLRSNLAHYTHDRKIKITANATFLETSVTGDKQYGRSGKLINAVMYRPISKIGTELEDFLNATMDEDLAGGSANRWMMNPIIQQESEYRKQTQRNVLLNAAADWNISNNFTLRAGGGLEYRTNINDWAYLKKSSTAIRSGGPSAGITHNDREKWKSELVLTYKKKFAGKHSITAMIGNELVSERIRSLSGEAAKFESEEILLESLQLGREYGRPKSSDSDNALASFFGRANYTYEDKYIVTASLRHDGSSVFARGKRWGTFPSTALGWRISQEKFMKNVDWVHNLKLRASIGGAGNNRIPANLYIKEYGYGYYGLNNGMETSASAKHLANPYLKWETLISRNVGVDFSFFHDRLSGSVDVYLNNSKDLLLKAEIRPESGFTTQYRNIGKTENKGLEISLNSVNVRTRDFLWTSDFNISFNKNKVKELADGNRMFMSSKFYSDVGNDYVIQVGQPLGTVWGYELHPNKFYRPEDFEADPYNQGKYRLKPGIPYFKDTQPQPGMIRFQHQGGANTVKVGAFDENGEEYMVDTPVIDPDNDRKIIGNTNPKFFGGFNNTFTYKNWDLSLFFTFVVGNDIYNANRYRFTSSYVKGQSMLGEMRGRFLTISPSGENLVTSSMKYENLATLERINQNATIWSPFAEMDRTNSWNIEDGSFLRLNNVTLGYTFLPKVKHKLGIRDLRVYATVYNVFVLTKYSGFDPEVDTHSSSNPAIQGMDYSAYPKSRQFVFGVNLTF